MDEYDVAIIGCGPAGLSAAIFCSRANLKTIVLGLQERSQARLADKIDNYFGFPEGVPGPMLLSKGMLQAQKFGATFLKQEVVTATPVDEDGKKSFIVKTSEGHELGSRALIIASGVPIMLSGISNEEKLTGKGVHYCVTCDGAFYKDKKLAIVGNSNHAAEDAIEALNYTKDVTIISNAQSFEFSDKYHDDITKWQIKTVLAKVKEFTGDKWFDSVQLDDGRLLKFDGVFMACGTAGALDFAANLGLEIRDNILVIDDSNMTSMDGVFAAGNCAGRCRQIAKNVGDGCNAAVNVIKYLRSRELYFDYAKHEDSVISIENQVAQEKQAKEHENEEKFGPSAPQSSPTRKLRIGWFSFSCCEDSTILFTELLNDYWDKWKDVLDIVHARVLRRDNNLANLDVAFVEGAISSDKAAEELREIRKNCKKLVAVGACACTGMPSAQRNTFDERKQKEIEAIVRAFDYNKTVLPVGQVVQVDDSVPGCPMTEAGFIAAVEKCLKEFGIHG